GRGGRLLRRLLVLRGLPCGRGRSGLGGLLLLAPRRGRSRAHVVAVPHVRGQGVPADGDRHTLPVRAGVMADRHLAVLVLRGADPGLREADPPERREGEDDASEYPDDTGDSRRANRAPLSLCHVSPSCVSVRLSLRWTRTPREPCGVPPMTFGVRGGLWSTTTTSREEEPCSRRRASGSASFTAARRTASTCASGGT